MNAFTELRGLADAANARRDGATCLQIHATISQLELILGWIDRLNAALDAAGAPRIGLDDAPACEARADA